MKELAKTYDPKSFEDRLYAYWLDHGYFKADVNPDKEPFTIVMPPPNVTGNLHMGHALNHTLQDLLIRWKRMMGYEALWLPGTDHASISTEVKVVEKLRHEGKSKEELGREGFLKEAWAWTEKYGGNIRNQLKKLGVSCDWSREAFTLDENLSRAVEETFVRLYEKGLIYQGDRIINWCPHCGTALSDAEVEHQDDHGHLWHVLYPLVDGKDGEGIIIATTRPETIMGDLAVAVHPEDERYGQLVGRQVHVPLTDRTVPIIADSYVDREFGTGAVKITPSHDPNDFEVGERAGLGQMVIMNLDATMADNTGKYAGMDRYEARKATVKDLKDQGYLVKEEEHDHAVGTCERCGTDIEKMISKQWFVAMETLAKPALDAYQAGDLDFIPERFGKIYVHWLENIRDWCISRQLWWGHRLPVYYCEDCGHVQVAREEPGACESCQGHHWRRDEDTLDTWFSSALWPFSTLGWPAKTEDMKYFYPTDVLVTGYDIIFFWVIRMVFSALELTGELPFHDVFLTGLIRDEQGRKMSKSLGNGIDPLDVIDAYGADALRFTLVTGNSPGNDMRFSYDRVEANRNFANKIWNATRFIMMNLSDDMELPNLDQVTFQTEDRWILSRLQETVEEVTKNLNQYEIGMAASTIYSFVWEEFCDWYIELVKDRLYGEDEDSKKTALSVLVHTLKDILKLLHPFMPFITEEIWQHLPGTESALIVASWPTSQEDWKDEETVFTMEVVMDAIKGIRNARAEMNVPMSKKARLLVLTESQKHQKIFQECSRYFLALGGVTEVVLTQREELPEDTSAVVLNQVELFLPLDELVDFEKERERLTKEKERLEGEVLRVSKKLANEGFVNKAPEAVVQAEREKEAKYQDMLKTVQAQLKRLQGK